MQRQTHLVVLVNGLWGWQRDWTYMKKALEASTACLIWCSAVNTGPQTYDGNGVVVGERSPLPCHALCHRDNVSSQTSAHTPQHTTPQNTLHACTTCRHRRLRPQVGPGGAPSRQHTPQPHHHILHRTLHGWPHRTLCNRTAGRAWRW